MDLKQMLRKNKSRKFFELALAELTGYRIYILRDVHNRIVHGDDAPRFAERLWMDIEDCSMRMKRMGRKDEISAKVIKGAWPYENSIPVEEISIIRDCVQHWLHGVPWEETDEAERIARAMEKYPGAYGCRSMSDIDDYLRRLDSLFDEIAEDGGLKPRDRVEPRNFRERGGIVVHVGPDGELFLGEDGNHRFAIAYSLNLMGRLTEKRVPVEVGCVHESAIDHLEGLREPPVQHQDSVSR